MRAWDDAWKTPEGRAEWLEPEPFVVAALRKAGAGDGRRALDLGAGVGRHAVAMARQGYRVVGLDSSPAGLLYAREWAAREGLMLDLVLGEMGALPWRAGAFDLVLAWNVIYHGVRADVECAAIEAVRCLRPDGLLVVSLISPRHAAFGVGRAVEPMTFVDPQHAERSHPHHYVAREEIAGLFPEMDLQVCEERAGHGEAYRDVASGAPSIGRAADWHWHIVARKRR